MTITLGVMGYLALFLPDVSSPRHFLATLIMGYVLVWAIYSLFSNISRPELLVRFALTTGSLVTMLILAEAPAFTGLIDYRAVLGSFESESALTVAGRHADPELLWQHDPYYEYNEPYQGNLGMALCVPPDSSQRVAVRYDRHGFRNSQDLDRADIVVLGDSYIEGYMTPEPLLVTTLLGRLQKKTVANLGHSGYGPQQQLAVLKRYGVALRPHTVIWTLFEGNDFSDAEEYERQRATAHNTFWENVWYRSLTRNALTRILQPPRACIPSSKIEEFQAHFRDEEGRVSRVLFAPSEVRLVSEDQLERALRSIAEAAALCKENHIRFLVAFIPEKYRVYHNLGNVQFISGAFRSWRVSSLPEEIRRRLTELDLGIGYVDLTSSLREAARKGIATYLRDDTHWTSAGNRVVAETLDQALRAFPFTGDTSPGNDNISERE
jgi:hypothetical protein